MIDCSVATEAFDDKEDGDAANRDEQEDQRAQEKVLRAADAVRLAARLQVGTLVAADHGDVGANARLVLGAPRAAVDRRALVALFVRVALRRAIVLILLARARLYMHARAHRAVVFDRRTPPAARGRFLTTSVATTKSTTMFLWTNAGH